MKRYLSQTNVMDSHTLAGFKPKIIKNYKEIL